MMVLELLVFGVAVGCAVTFYFFYKIEKSREDRMMKLLMKYMEGKEK